MTHEFLRIRPTFNGIHLARCSRFSATISSWMIGRSLSNVLARSQSEYSRPGRGSKGSKGESPIAMVRREGEEGEGGDGEKRWPNAVSREWFYGPNFQSSPRWRRTMGPEGVEEGREDRGLGLAEFKRVVRVAVNFLPQDSSEGREGERAGSEGPRANVRLRHTHISPASSINNSSRNLAQTRLVPDNAGRASSKNKLARRGKFAAGYRRLWLAGRRREAVISIGRSSRTRVHRRTFGETRQSFIETRSKRGGEIRAIPGHSGVNLHDRATNHHPYSPPRSGGRRTWLEPQSRSSPATPFWTVAKHTSSRLPSRHPQPPPACTYVRTYVAEDTRSSLQPPRVHPSCILLCEAATTRRT